MRRSTLLAPCLALLIACGGGAAGSRPAGGGTTAGSTAAVPIAPLKLVGDDDGKTILEMKADGTIVLGSGEAVARLHDDKLTGSQTGKTIVFHADGTITPDSGPSEPKLRFDERGDMTMSTGEKVAVGADGVPSYTDAQGTKPIPAHVVGLQPSVHRTAVVLVFVAAMAMHTEQPDAPSTATDATPPPEPPPATKKTK